MNAVCIGCRLRRKKCDRGKPICSSCLELNISPDLCIYPKSKLQLASKDSKITLNLIRSKNKRLKEKYQQLHDLYQRKVSSSSSASIPIVNTIITSTSPITTNNFTDQQFNDYGRELFPSENGDVKDPLLTSIKETNKILLHTGPLSWAALMNAEHDLDHLCLQFDEIMELAKILRQDERQDDFVGEADSDIRFNAIKDRLTNILLGIDSIENINQVMNELFNEIEIRLPPFDMVMTLVHRFFIMSRIQKMGVIELNEHSFYESLTQIISKDINGRVKLTVLFPQENHKTPCVALLLSIVSTMLFQVNQLLNPASASANHLLILDCIKVLFVTLSIFKRTSPHPEELTPPEIRVQVLQGFLYFFAFDRYNPHGREHESADKTGENAVYVRELITYAKGLRLNENIDVVYKEKSKNYRRSLKSMWFTLVYLDNNESIELGLPTKIRKNELFNYDDFQDEYTKALVVSNELISDFQSIENIQDPHKFISLVQTLLIVKTKNTLCTLFKPVHEDLKILDEMDFDNLALVHKFMSITQTFNVRLLLIGLIQSYYHHCYKRLEMSGYRGEMLEKYHILSMKYSLLVFQIVAGIFSAYRRLWGHENSATFGSLGTILSIFPAMKFSFRRVTIFPGARIFEGLPVDKPTAILELFEMGQNETDGEVLGALIMKEKPKFFGIRDLEDLNIDDHDELLRMKFSAFLDYKYSLLSCAAPIYALNESLYNTTYNLNFVRLNRAFYLATKLISFFTRLLYNIDIKGKDIKSTMNTTDIDNFSMHRYFEHAVNSPASKFDAEKFFGAPSGFL